MIQVFNGAHTIQNRQTGEHRTFEIHTVRKGQLKGKRIIALLTGPYNNSSYKKFAFLNYDGTISVWKKYKSETNKKSIWEMYALMIKAIIIDKIQDWTDKYDQQVEKTCLICSRRLINPASLETGIGPECSRKLRA